jgi:hypothetical protein
MYKSIIRPLLFRLDPEQAHHVTFSLLKNFGFLAKLFLPKPIVYSSGCFSSEISFGNTTKKIIVPKSVDKGDDCCNSYCNILYNFFQNNFISTNLKIKNGIFGVAKVEF